MGCFCHNGVMYVTQSRCLVNISPLPILENENHKTDGIRKESKQNEWRGSPAQPGPSPQRDKARPSGLACHGEAALLHGPLPLLGALVSTILGGTDGAPATTTICVTSILLSTYLII